jgi:hypothetical protein
MYGPEPAGTWSSMEAQNCGKRHQFLDAGQRYRVIRPFTDFDGTEHPVGEEWTFLGCAFVPYDDGLSWFVSLDGEREWHIRMQWRDESQGRIIDALSAYVGSSGTPEAR